MEKSNDTRILFSILWVSLFLFLGKLAGAAKEMAIAWKYGVSPIVDAYVFVFNMLAWPGGLFSAICLSLLIPLCLRWRENKHELSLFRRELTGLTCCMALCVTVVISAVLGFALSRGWAVQDKLQMEFASGMLLPLTGVILPGFLIGLFSAWTLIQGKQQNTLLEAVPSCVICVALVFSEFTADLALVFGTTVGFLLQAFFLAWPLWRERILDGICVSFKSLLWRDFWKSFKFLFMGQIALGLCGMCDLIVAVRLIPGDLAAFSYSNRILGLAFSFGGVAISRAVLPVFSSLQENSDEMKKLSIRWAWTVGILGGGMALLLWFCAPWMMKIFFERGAFDETASNAVTSIFRYGVLQLPFYFVWTIFVAYLSARWKFQTLAYIFGLNLLVKICCLLVFVPNLGIKGVQISSCVMYCCSLLALYLTSLYNKRYL